MPPSVFRHLEKTLREHLADINRLASHADDRAVLDLARVELPRMVTALRSLLDEHQPDQNGRCPTCRTRWWSRRLPSPCRAYLTAHLCLTPSEETPGQHGNGHHGHHLRPTG